MCVIALVALGGIRCRARDHIVKVDVGVGGEGVVETYLLAGGVGEGIPIGTP